jgi:branched-chain amino acid transport system permease protein
MTKSQSDRSVDTFVERDSITNLVRAHPVRVLGLATILLVLPWALVQASNQYWLTLMVELFIFAIAVLSFDLLLGYTGLLSFGHALFFGMGTYTVAIVSRETSLSFLGAVPVALVVVPVFAVFVGLVALRLRSVYFAIIMLAFGQLGYQIILQLTWLTGGINGISGLTIPTLFGINPTGPYAAYYITLLVLACVYIGLRRVVNSPFGHVLQGIHQNENRMRMLGINVYQHKLVSFTLAAFVGGIGGTLYPLYLNFIDPSLVNWTTTGDMLMMTLIGGMGTLWGPIFGAGFYILVQGLLESTTDRWRIVLGIIFVIFILLFPSGIAGLFDDDAGPSGKLHTVRNRINDLIGDQGRSRDE